MIRLDAEKHIYIVDGKVIPSVTQILQAEGIISYGVSEWHMKKGKYLHDAIRLYLDDNLDEKTLDPVLEPYFSAFQEFLKDTRFHVNGYEEPLYHPQYGYAGTPDLWGTLNRKIQLIDIKTGSYANWHLLQLGAYQELCRANGIEITVAANLYLSEKGKYSLKSFTFQEVQKGLSVFLSCLTIYKWKKEETNERN